MSSIMARILAYLFITCLTAACTTQKPLSLTDEALEIRKIRIDKSSKQSDGSVEMISRCSGFILSEKEVHDFLVYASRLKKDGPDKYYRILPCSATGSIVINKRKYDWVIRAGGVAEFSASNDQFIAICGKKCCEKVPGIC